jgi:general secretion pathway protein J
MIRTFARITPSQRGFTLLEMLVALTLLGFVILGVQNGVSFGARAWESERPRQSDIQRGQAVRNLLTAVLERAYPLAVRHDNDEPTIAFNGAERTLSLVSDAPRAVPDRGKHLVELELRPTGNRYELVMRWHPLQGSTPEEIGADVSGEVTLLRDVSDVSFAYMPAQAAGEHGSWVSTWPSARELPRLVRVSIKMDDGRPGFELPLVVRLMLSGTAECLTRGWCANHGGY